MKINYFLLFCCFMLPLVSTAQVDNWSRLFNNEGIPVNTIGWLEETMQKREMAVGISRGVEMTSVGCPFFNRCPMAIEGTCNEVVPPILTLNDGHEISCHLTLDQLNEVEAETRRILDDSAA